MRHRRAAVPYAKALFTLVKERNQTELVGRELGDLAATFESDFELRDFFTRPSTPATAKRTVATEVYLAAALVPFLNPEFAAEHGARSARTSGFGLFPVHRFP